MDKIDKLILGIICSASLILFILCSSITYVSYNLDFMLSSYEKYNTLERIPVSQEDLEKVTVYLLDYLKDHNKDLNVQAVINGVEQNFYNEREIAHMVDVKNLFALNQNLWALSGTFMVLLGYYFYLQKEYTLLTKTILSCVIMALVLLTCITLFVSLDFTNAFTIFHEMFFTNDLWILDYSKDYLLNLVPEPFFVDIAIRLGTVLIGAYLTVIIASIVTLNKLKESDRIKEQLKAKVE